MIINLRVHQHAVCPFLHENLQTVHLIYRIAFLSSRGYVHSQRRTSTARDNKNPDPLCESPMLFDNIFEPDYRLVRQTYHNYVALPNNVITELPNYQE